MALELSKQDNEGDDDDDDNNEEQDTTGSVDLLGIIIQNTAYY